MNPMKSWLLFFGICFLSQDSYGSFDPFGTLLTPPGSDKKEGDGSIGDANMAVHFQQVFPSSFFGELPPGGAWLQSFALRADASAISLSGELTGTQIAFSTTKTDSSSLSPVYSENIGADFGVFLPKNRTVFVSSGIVGSPVGPQGYGTSFQADGLGTTSKGFFYDPAKGNLLLDIQGFHIETAGPGSWRFDTFTMPGNSIVRFRAPDDPIQGTLRPDGLVVLFQFSIPEPNSMRILGASVAAGVLILKRPKRLQSPLSH